MNYKANVKKLRFGLALSAALVVADSMFAGELTWGTYAAAPGGSGHTSGEISFKGNSTFSFTDVSGVYARNNPNAGYSFTINSSADSLDNFDLGQILGTFTMVGPISPTATTVDVTGTGTLLINDGYGFDLTASLNFISISQKVPGGSESSLNDDLVVNLSKFNYTGTDAGLLALANGSDQALTLDFTFAPAETLYSLSKGHFATAYSGSIDYSAAVPDSGGTALLIGLGFGGIAVGTLSQRRKHA